VVLKANQDGGACVVQIFNVTER